MLTMAAALKEMESEDRNGQRKPMSIVIATANRELWSKYQKLCSSQRSLPSGSKAFKELQKKIDAVAYDMGGRFVNISNCILTGRTGKGPSKAEIRRAEMKNDLIKDPRHYNNKTRNVKILTSGQSRKFHIKLLMQKDKVKVIH